MGELVWNVLQVSLTTSVVILPAWLFCAVLRRRYPARVICLLWVILSIRLLVPVQITFPDTPVITPKTTVTVALPNRDPIQTQLPETVRSEEKPQDTKPLEQLQSEVRTPIPEGITENIQPQKQFDITLLLAGVWFVGMITLFLVSLTSHRQFWKRIKRSARDVQGETLLAVYQQEKDRLNIQREIPVMQSFAVEGPMLAGLLHPVLLLPKDGIADTEVRMILRHELTHYKHGDLFCKLLFLLARCVHWFNPVVHLLARQGAQDLEIACDQAVVHGLDDDARRTYGKCILSNAARRVHHREQSFTTQLTGGKKAMKTRLQALFTRPKKQYGIAFLLIAFFAVTMVGSSFAVKSGNTPDAETVQQMEELAQRWCDAQKNQLTPAQAETLLGGSLKEKFDEMVQGYVDVRQDTPFSFDNLPMGAQADTVSYTQNPKAYTAKVKVHTNDTPYGGMTQLQTIRFAQEGEELRIVDRTVDEAMLLDHPEEICMTAQDVMKRGMPENPVDTHTAMALVYENFPIAGGQYYFDGLDKNLIIYSFADSTMVYFEFEMTPDNTYHLKNVIEPQNHTPNQSDAQRIAANQTANQWASGYLHKNAAFSYPVMSKKMQQEFISKQEADYGTAWFWRVGWGSSPSVKFWIVEPESENSALVVYWLYAGGEEFRYTERLKFITENGKVVVDDCEVVADGVLDHALSREEFIMLYAASEDIERLPPKIDDALIQEWKDNEKTRYEKLLTPEGALKAIIGRLDRKEYTIKRVSEEMSVHSGVDIDLAIVFPDSDESVFVTMHGKKTDGEETLWQIGRFWSGEPDHTT